MAEREWFTIRLLCECGEVFEVKVPSRLCPDCQVKREGILDQAEPDFNEPAWQERQSRWHKAQVIKEATSAGDRP